MGGNPVYPLISYSSWSHLLPCCLLSLVSSCLFRKGWRQQQHSLKAFSLIAGQRRCHFAFVWVHCLPCWVAATSVHPTACTLTAPNPAGLVGHWGKSGLLPRKPESTVKSGNSPEKALSPNISHHIHPPPPPLYTLLSTFLSLSLTHSYSLHISYSHLFTFSFKIFVYKCVYKLKIISSCSFSKWHLQGKGCVGLRFLIALQEPTERQHRTLSKTAWERISADRGGSAGAVCFYSIPEKMTRDLGP